MSDKTEQPTPRRLEKAREEGDSPVSGALSQAVAFVAAMAIAPATLAMAAEKAHELIRTAMGRAPGDFGGMELALPVISLSLPVVGAAAFAAAAIGFAQTGGVIATKKLIPKFDRLNPATGLKNLVSVQRLISIARALLFSGIMCYITINAVRQYMPEVARAVGRIHAVPVIVSKLARKLGWNMALIGLGLAGLDLLVVRQGWLKRNRMSKDEIKREYKESEGDPEVKAARKRAHKEAMAGSMVRSVKDASVLVVNPTHLAIALRYNEDDDEAPRVIAQGEGDLALKMIDAARIYGVPVVRDIPVARALSEVELGEEIPEVLYEAVAEILREIWEEQEGGTSNEEQAAAG